MRGRRWQEPVAFAIVASVVVLCAGVPLVALAAQGLSGRAAALLSSSATWSLLLWSISTSAAVTVIALAIGVPLGVLLGGTDVIGRRAALLIHAFPTSLPPFFLALGWFHWFGREGFLLGGRVVSERHRIVIPPDERNVGAVFQDLALWPHLTVHGNLAFGLSRVVRADRDARIAAMLERVGLGAKARSHPGELSGGEQQRVAIARALILEPRVVAFDEPLANLDVVLKQELLDLFGVLLRERGAAAIYVTHDPREAEVLADRVAVIEAGRLVQIATMNELRTRPASLFIDKLLSICR